MKTSNRDPRCELKALRRLRLGIALALLASGASAVASATGVQWTGPLTISLIEVVGNEGGFIVYLSGFSDSNCSTNPTGIYIYPGNQGVPQAGANQMLAGAIAARASGTQVSVFYDDTTAICEGEYLTY